MNEFLLEDNLGNLGYLLRNEQDQNRINRRETRESRVHPYIHSTTKIKTKLIHIGRSDKNKTKEK